MPQHAEAPPETDILCEHCGYGLNGLPTDGLCPECGQPIADSTVADGRVPPAWESQDGSALGRFARTTAQIISGPSQFFRHLNTRSGVDRSKRFAVRQHALSALLLGTTAVIHADAMDLLPQLGDWTKFGKFLLPLPAAAMTWLVLRGITRLASNLTRLEGGYWGYRLPIAVVRRAMNFHTAQLLPIAIVALLTVAGYDMLRHFQFLSAMSAVPYLIVICVEVLIAAAYLFRTYWIAMKNIMYANR